MAAVICPMCTLVGSDGADGAAASAAGAGAGAGNSSACGEEASREGLGSDTIGIKKVK
jgi:hypothetical protein